MFLGRWPRLGWNAPLALQTPRHHRLLTLWAHLSTAPKAEFHPGLVHSQSPFSANGATNTSLGHRPREPAKAPRSGEGLKARPMHAARRFGDPGGGKAYCVHGSGFQPTTRGSATDETKTAISNHSRPSYCRPYLRLDHSLMAFSREGVAACAAFTRSAPVVGTSNPNWPITIFRSHSADSGSLGGCAKSSNPKSSYPMANS